MTENLLDVLTAENLYSPNSLEMTLLHITQYDTQHSTKEYPAK